MNILAFPPLLFPSVSWFVCWLTSEHKCVKSDWSWQKQSAFNRFYIDGPNGMQVLTIPVKHPLKGMRCDQIEISYHTDWPSLHLKTLHSTYNNSPFYEFLQNNLEDLYSFRPVCLIDFALASIGLVMQWLKEKKIEPHLDCNTKNLQLLDIEIKNGAISNVNTKPYVQVFSYKNGFIANLSVIDLIFNEGPLAKSHLLDYESIDIFAKKNK